MSRAHQDPIRFYFDFISPYSYLAISLIERGRDASALRFELRPVALGSVFSSLGVPGPGDVPHRRRYGLSDVLLLAEHYQVPLEGPPKHPFNSLYALRAVAAEPDPVRGFDLTHALFRACWGRGESLEDLDTLRRCFNEVGLDLDPEEVASRSDTRRAVKENTRMLLDAGGFGVPSFEGHGLLLFGHDRLELLEALSSGAVAADPEKLERLLARPHPGATIRDG